MKKARGVAGGPLFSIIVPLYNKAGYIAACLDRIKEQTELSWECVVINDGSTDGGEKVAESFAEEDHRFKLVNQKNLGPSIARNRGIQEARGKILHFLDADDYYPDTTTLETVGKIYLKDIPTAIAGSIGVLTSKDTPVNYDLLEVNSKSNKTQSFRELQNDYYFTRFFFDRKFIVDNSITFPTYTRVGEDPIFLVKALSLMDQFIVTNIPVYVYNTLGSSANVFGAYDDDEALSYSETQIEILEICKQHGYKALTKRILDRIDAQMLDGYIKKSIAGNKAIGKNLEKLLSFMSPEIYHERIIRMRERDDRITELEEKIHTLESQILQISQPGIKISFRKLIGALKRRIKKGLRRLS